MEYNYQHPKPKTTLTEMFKEKLTNKLSNTFKGIHRRLLSVASATKSASQFSLAEYLLSDEPRHHDERDTRLFSVDKLEIPEKHQKWFEAINMAARAHMNSSEYDASHDYEHIQRVVMNANSLWLAKKHHEKFYTVDPLVIYVAAMVHDIGNAKYGGDKTGEEAVLESEDVDMETDDKDQERQRDAMEAFIKKAHRKSGALLMHDPDHGLNECKAYPALQIVQDVERLDAFGALGIARACVYGGTQQPQGTGSVRGVVEMVDQRLSRYVSFMKTREGKKDAEKKWAVMRRIRDEMVDEAYCEYVLEAY